MRHAVGVDGEVDGPLRERRRARSVMAAAAAVDAVLTVEAALPAGGIGRRGARAVSEVRRPAADLALTRDGEARGAGLAHAQRLDVGGRPALGARRAPGTAAVVCPERVGCAWLRDDDAICVGHEHPGIRYAIEKAVSWLDLSVQNTVVANDLRIQIGQQWEGYPLLLGEFGERLLIVIGNCVNFDSRSLESVKCIAQLPELRPAGGSPNGGTVEH